MMSELIIVDPGTIEPKLAGAPLVWVYADEAASDDE